MTVEPDVKQQVREFYDQVGWQRVSEDTYQNARYEDLRPVSQTYLRRCHLRVKRHLKTSGKYMLDAGSGPIQYPEYLVYSEGYRYRVCADISYTALQEARKRIGDHGLFVVADIANLPFSAGVFESFVSLHTIHHLPEAEHRQAYRELFRVLADQSPGVVVNGWPVSRLMRAADPVIRLGNRIRNRTVHRGETRPEPRMDRQPDISPRPSEQNVKTAKGTFTNRHDVSWVKQQIGGEMPIEILVWRSISVRFMRSLIHPRLLGKTWLALIYRLEESFPHFFGENGQYPLIVIRKGRSG